MSAALVHRYRPPGLPAASPVPPSPSGPCYWKPIQTGIEQDDDTATVRRLAGLDSAHVLDEGVRLRRPLSPHLAARLSGRAIELQPLVELAATAAPRGRWIIEGAGGALVPINDAALMIDLMVHLALPVVVAARSSLGTINHTLLTLEALRARKLTVAGVVVVGAPDRENCAAIASRGGVAILGELPRLEPLTAESLGRWAAAALDRDGLLAEYLG